MIIRNSALVSEYRRAFNRIWKAISDRWLEIPDPGIEKLRDGVRDGVNNDYDRKADAEDPDVAKIHHRSPRYLRIGLCPKGQGKDSSKASFMKMGEEAFYPPRSRYYTKRVH